MEARITRLETLAEVTDKRLAAIEFDTKEIRKEIHGVRMWVVYVVAAGCLSLGGSMWAAYAHLDTKVDARFAQTDAKIDKLAERMDAKFDKILERLPVPAAKQ